MQMSKRSLSVIVAGTMVLGLCADSVFAQPKNSHLKTYSYSLYGITEIDWGSGVPTPMLETYFEAGSYDLGGHVQLRIFNYATWQFEVNIWCDGPRFADAIHVVGTGRVTLDVTIDSAQEDCFNYLETATGPIGVRLTGEPTGYYYQHLNGTSKERAHTLDDQGNLVPVVTHMNSQTDNYSESFRGVVGTSSVVLEGGALLQRFSNVRQLK